jgi:hypothetical protein
MAETDPLVGNQPQGQAAAGQAGGISQPNQPEEPTTTDIILDYIKRGFIALFEAIYVSCPFFC